MSWAEVHWKSEVLEKETTMQVLLPQVGAPPFATLYLLHSLKDDSYGWIRKTRLEWHVRRLPLIIVMPDGNRSFFTDNNEGPAYARHVGEEVVDFRILQKRGRASSGRCGFRAAQGSADLPRTPLIGIICDETRPVPSRHEASPIHEEGCSVFCAG